MPFIGWTADVPLVGPYATQLLQAWADTFASTVLRRTGEQFFHLDGDRNAESPPLLVLCSSWYPTFTTTGWQYMERMLMVQAQRFS